MPSIYDALCIHCKSANLNEVSHERDCEEFQITSKCLDCGQFTKHLYNLDLYDSEKSTEYTPKEKQTPELGRHLYQHIARGAKGCGSFDPKEILCYFEEELTLDELETVVPFLTWLHTTGRTIGHGNYEEVFAEFRATGAQTK